MFDFEFPTVVDLGDGFFYNIIEGVWFVTYLIAWFLTAPLIALVP